jgi:nucleoid DNA-binding protein
MNERINLQDLSVLLAEKAAITKKEAETFLREYFDIINEELIKDRLLRIKDLGTFKLHQVEDRESIDVTTGERVLIPAHYKVTFAPDKKLAETVNEPFAFFETTEIEDGSVLEELKLLPGEDALEESEPTPEEDVSEEFEPISDEEENIVEKELDTIVKEKQSFFAEKEPVIIIEKEPEPVAETLHQEQAEEIEEIKEPIQDRKPLANRNENNECLSCHYFKSHHTYREKYHKNKRKLNRLRIIIIILSILLLAALGYIAYMLPLEKYIPFFESSQVDMPIQSVSKKHDIVPTVSKTSTDSMTPVEKPVEKPVKKETIEKSEPPKPFGESKQMVVAAGQRLTTIALNEYGNKAFWIYIYLENKAIIPNPNVLPVGLKITIPPAGKYGIDSNNPASIQKAKDLAVKRS